MQQQVFCDYELDLVSLMQHCVSQVLMDFGETIHVGLSGIQVYVGSWGRQTGRQILVL